MLATGRALEEYAAKRAERERSSLLSRAPRPAHRLHIGSVETIPVEDVVVGDTLVVKEGDILPVEAFAGFARSAQLRLDRLDAAVSVKDLAAFPGNRFETLSGDRKGEYSIHTNDQWRICCQWPEVLGLRSREATMDQLPLRHLIQRKLADGRLPRNSIPQVWGGAGNGETCDACEEAVSKQQLLMEGLSAGKMAVQFHVRCFSLWDELRRTPGT